MIVVRAVHGDDKQNNKNISNNKLESERKGDHYLITFSNYTNSSNILFHCKRGGVQTMHRNRHLSRIDIVKDE